ARRTARSVPAMRLPLASYGPASSRLKLHRRELGRRQTAVVGLGLELLLEGQHLVAKVDEVDAGFAALGEHALGRLFLFLHVMLDLFAENRDLGLEQGVV